MRKPAVAGMFYPRSREELLSSVKRYLKEGKESKLPGKLKALIVPHAGYIYSGIVAGAGFKAVTGKYNKDNKYNKFNKYNKVILLGPSHYVYFTSASIATEDFETPLGIVKIGETKLWLKEDLIIGLKEAHIKEHCLEVELPFLLETVKNFELYALVLGDVDEKELAKSIKRFIDDKTLIVVSSDLSHYLDYNAAQRTDKETIAKILIFDFSSLEACGEKAIKVLMYLAKEFNWKPYLIDYKNSGDTAGDKSRVVGYASIAYVI
ncbi:MAG: AmmeMemoRadiSam system protein B [Nanoarchaeota archaeon]